MQMSLKDCFCTLFFRPKTRPRTSLQCFALDSRYSKAKHCRDVLGGVLGQKNKVQNPSLIPSIRTSYILKNAISARPSLLEHKA